MPQFPLGGRKFLLRRLALVSALALVAASSVAHAAVAADTQPVDIELAVDTTSSMAPSIEQAKRDGRRVVEDVRRVLPDARFAVVSFRDYQNPAGEYDVLQPLTGDVALATAALEKLRPFGNPSPNNIEAESYNLVFRNSHADPSLGWRPESRKLVVVIGDAQPYGAGAAGLDGCDDVNRDPRGFSTASELQAMRAAKRTLILVRQVSESTSATLRCYQSLAERAFVGGAARDGVSADLAALVLDLVQAATTPVSVAPDLPLGLRAGTNGLTVSVLNPNGVEIKVTTLAVVLPRGFRYLAGSATGAASQNPAVSGRTLTWDADIAVAAFGRTALHFRVGTARWAGRYAVKASAGVEMPNGTAFTSRSRPARVRLVRRLGRVKLAFEGSGSSGSSAAIRGSATIIPGRSNRSLAGRSVTSSVELTLTRGRSLSLQIRSYRVLALGATTKLRFRVRVGAAQGMPRCAGALGSLTVTNSGSLLADRRVADVISVRFRGRCTAAALWSNAASGGQAVVVVKPA